MSMDLKIMPDGACFLGPSLLHPASFPLEAARQELDGLLSTAKACDTVVLAGLGLGWHAKAILDHSPSPKLVIFEPDSQKLDMMRCLGPFLSHMELARDENSLVEILGEHLVYDRPGKACVFSPNAYKEQENKLFQKAKDTLNSVLDRSHVNQSTKLKKDDLWLDNLVENFRQILLVPDITLLKDALEGMPALVVGAGPSLDLSLSKMVRAKDKALVLGAASAIGPLAGINQSLHVAMALEGKDESRQFVKADYAQTILACATSGHCNHFLKWQGQKVLFHLQEWVAYATGMGQVLPTGGHATSAAFSLAFLLGCDPIILIGQDLAFTNGRIHASNRPGGEDELMPDIYKVPAIGGGKAETSSVMLSYLSWYQEAASFLSKNHPTRRFINCTEQGAFISGFEEADLRDVLNGLPDLKGASDLLIGSVPRLPKANRELAIQRLAGLKSHLKMFLNESEKSDSTKFLRKENNSPVLKFILDNSSASWKAEDYRKLARRLTSVIDQMKESFYV